MNITSDQGCWAPRSAALGLENDEVHVWCVVLDKSAPSVQSLMRTLSSEEAKRADGLRFSHDRDRFIVSHGSLRTILGLYLDISPEKISFRNNSFGKPFLDTPTPNGDLQFNVSHSNDLALFAVTRARRVGIDVECIRPFAEMDQMIDRFFSSREKQAVRSASAGNKLQTFLVYWTYKEANIKARGAGLSIALHRLDTFDSGTNFNTLADTHEDQREFFHWRTFELPPPFPDYVAALTVEEVMPYRLSCWQWQE